MLFGCFLLNCQLPNLSPRSYDGGGDNDVSSRFCSGFSSGIYDESRGILKPFFWGISLTCFTERTSMFPLYDPLKSTSKCLIIKQTFEWYERRSYWNLTFGFDS